MIARKLLIFVVAMAYQLCLFAEEKVADKHYENCVNEFALSVREQMEKELNLQLIMPGGIFHDYLKRGMRFYAYRLATLDEARAIQLAVMGKLAEVIGANQDLLPYIKEKLYVDIEFVDADRRAYKDGSIENVYLRRDHSHPESQKWYLEYQSTDPFSDYSQKDEEIVPTRFNESYENAVLINALLTNNPALHEPKEFEKELDQILTTFTNKMEKKQLHFLSIGWMEPGKATPDILEIRAKCELLYPSSLRAARKLMLTAASQLLDAINNSETLKPYLKEAPFPPSRLKLRMLFRQHKFFVGHVPFYDGSVESIVLNKNDLTYYHYIPDPKRSDYHDKVVYKKESYQEAQKALTIPTTMLEEISEVGNNLSYWFSSMLQIAGLILGIFFVILGGGFWVLLAIIVFCLVHFCRKK